MPRHHSWHEPMKVCHDGDPPVDLPWEEPMNNTSLTALAREQLKLATTATSGRSARTVFGGRGHSLRQTMIALIAGRRLDDHANPGEGTVHVLHGRVRLEAGDDSWEGAAGHLIDIPEATHALLAMEDAVVLLTVVIKNRPSDE